MNVAHHRLELGMGAFCGLLAVLLFYENAAPLPEFDPPALAWSPRPVRTVNVFFGPPSEAAFGVIDERPIFNPARKPVDASAAPGAPGAATALAPPNATLIGVIADSKNQLAMIKEQGAPFAVSLAVGGMLEGWQVSEIASDHIVLRAGSAQVILSMNGTRTNASAQNKIPGIQPLTNASPVHAPPAPMNALNPAQNDKQHPGL